MKKNLLSIFFLSTVFLSFAVEIYAIGGPPIINLNITQIGLRLVNAVWVVFTIIAVIMFLVAGILFLTAQGQPEKIQQAKKAFLWGVAGIAVGILAFGIIRLTCNMLGTSC